MGIRDHKPFPNKEAAVAAVLEAGFTEHVDSSESGDWGPGSREYYCRPGAERNRYGFPIEVASVSRVTSIEWWADMPAPQPEADASPKP